MKVLIVDDELLVRIGLKSSINWQKYGMEIAGQAENGLQALELTREIMPEIIFLDMKMPGMNGLKFMESLKTEGLSPKIIVLSSFDDFELVKEAMKLGAVEYIHKPRMNANDIDQILKQVKQSIEREQDIKEANSIDNVALRKAIIRDLVEGVPVDRDKFRDICEKHNINLVGTHFACLVFSVSSLKQIQERYRETGKELLQTSIIDILSSILAREKGIEIFYYEKNLYVVLISFENVIGYQEIISSINTISYLIEDALKQFLDIQICMGVSPIAISSTKIKDIFFKACTALEYNFFTGNGTIIHYEDINTKRCKEAMDKVYNMVEGLKTLLVRDDIGKSNEQLEELVNYLEEYKCLSEAEIKGIFNGLLFLVKGSKSGLIEMERINQCEKLDDLYHVFKDILDDQLHDKSKFDLNETSHYLVKEVIAFIDKNYYQEITLSLLSEGLNISPSYISRLFREETGRQLFDYINEFRIEKACRLLSDKTLKIYEIASMTGFNSAVHFNIVFNRYIGISPKQYRKQTFKEYKEH